MRFPITFYVPAGLVGPSGGNMYNAAVIDHLRTLGVQVEVHPVPGPWPRPRPWRGPDPGGIAVVDGLIASSCPAAIERATNQGGHVYVVVHMATPADLSLTPSQRARATTLEGAALHAATGVVTTSHWSADDLARRYGLAQVHVASPGVDPAPLAAGSTPVRILALGAVTPVKNQFTMLRALARCLDLPWSARVVGSTAVDRGYAARLRRTARDFPTGRIRVLPPQASSTLERTWGQTDLCVLPSRTETFGLVVTEALARGIPAVVSAGTGAVEALSGSAWGRSAGSRASLPGAAVDNDVEALTRVLRNWLIDADLRTEWARRARIRRAELPGWDVTAATWLSLLSRGREVELHARVSAEGETSHRGADHCRGTGYA